MRKSTNVRVRVVSFVVREMMNAHVLGALDVKKKSLTAPVKWSTKFG